MLCTRCRIRTAVTDDGLRTFCPGTRPPLPDGRVADGICRGSAPTGREGGRGAVSEVLLDVRWGLWLASTVFGQFTARMTGSSETPGQTAQGLAPVASADVLEIVAAVPALLFVRALTWMQVERAALAAPQPAAVRPGPADAAPGCRS
ncbi:DUF4328 domain-containing protein [Streptomyces sp. YIM 132580]|uniref:DUF4328 domain-containing protein n=1 Tax=Streptomyces sp. YIM 132580 TaxID=2691958 RepID=UPI00136F3C56|nr:DUF4328 domain-containing protein [Streptomyces sp. YIM 132580]MXG24743.1 DUF4328 domain-containing protein [Streptomyces sp. YIM 132580]